MKVKLEINGEARYLTKKELDMPLAVLLGEPEKLLKVVK